MEHPSRWMWSLGCLSSLWAAWPPSYVQCVVAGFEPTPVKSLRSSFCIPSLTIDEFILFKTFLSSASSRPGMQGGHRDC